MVAWICDTAPAVLDLLPAPPRRRCGPGSGSPTTSSRTWAEMSRKMFVPFHGDGIISQFEGYDDLEELDWDALPRASTPQHPAPRPDPARPRATIPTATSWPSRPTR